MTASPHATHPGRPDLNERCTREIPPSPPSAAPRPAPPLLSLFLVPVLYSLLARFTKPSSHIANRLRELEAEHADRERGAKHEAPPAPAE